MAISNENGSKNRRKSKSVVTTIRKMFSLNIGTIIFGAIFLYMIVTVIMYITANPITSYLVTSGPLSRNQTYTGLVMRDEQVVYADTSGYVTYYARGNSNVKKNGVVYSIGSSQTVSADDETLDAASVSDLRSQMASFSTNFDLQDYNSVYNLKYELESSLLQYSGVIMPSGSTDAAAVTVGGQTVCAAPDAGLVVYAVDGYEEYDESAITAADIQNKGYHLENLKTNETIEAGDPVYKLISSEQWSVYIPLTDRQIIQLSDRTSIRVKFLKDDSTQVANFSILTQEDGTYLGKLTFNNGLIRYAADRFLNIELVTNTQSGLKIPISSIVKKDFYTIPEDFAAYGGDNSEIGFLKETKDSNGNTTTTFVNVTLYENKDGLYYVDMDDFDLGDTLIKPDSSNRYTIGLTASLEGAYCINRGYAVFRKVVIIDKNEEYCIVETGTSYGLAQFDHIVYDSTTVNEDQILY